MRAYVKKSSRDKGKDVFLFFPRAERACLSARHAHAQYSHLCMIYIPLCAYLCSPLFSVCQMQTGVGGRGDMTIGQGACSFVLSYQLGA